MHARSRVLSLTSSASGTSLGINFGEGGVEMRASQGEATLGLSLSDSPNMSRKLYETYFSCIFEGSLYCVVCWNGGRYISNDRRVTRVNCDDVTKCDIIPRHMVTRRQCHCAFQVSPVYTPRPANMPPVSSQMSLKRIHREISDVGKEDLGPITLVPTDNLYAWKGTIPGPEGSPYEGGVFAVDIVLATDYPYVIFN